LRNHQHVEHVIVRKEGGGYVVSYSVAAWYLEELEKARTRL